MVYEQSRTGIREKELGILWMKWNIQYKPYLIIVSNESEKCQSEFSQKLKENEK